MSGCPRCASVAPSHRPTSAWTIDCGWTTTSIRSYGVPNSQCASITSRPLFISVAESIVILPPIAHVGCRSACSTVTPSSSARRAAAERPARRRDREPLDCARRARRRSAGAARECSESTGMSWAPVASESAITSSPPTTSDSLLASATSMPSVSATIVGPSPAEPDDRVEHEVGAGLGDQPRRAPRGRRAPRRRSRSPPRAPRRRGRSARSGARRARAPARSAPRASARRTGRRARRPRERARRRRAPGCRSSRSSRGSGAASYRRPSVARGSFGVAKARLLRASGRRNHSPTIASATRPV